MIPTLNQLSMGQVGNVQAVINSVCKKRTELDTVLNEYDRPPVRVMDFDHDYPTMDEMCRKYGEPFIAVLRENREMKLLHNLTKKGFALGRNRWKCRYTAEIPVQIAGNRRNPLYWIFFNPECTDKYERRKNLYIFLRMYDMAFSPIERL